jgi:hypothetical protein
MRITSWLGPSFTSARTAADSPHNCPSLPSVYRQIPRYRLEAQRVPPTARLVYRQSIGHDQERQELGVAICRDLLGADGTVNGVIWKSNVGARNPLRSTTMECAAHPTRSDHNVAVVRSILRVLSELLRLLSTEPESPQASIASTASHLASLR